MQQTRLRGGHPQGMHRTKNYNTHMKEYKELKIAVAGTGYVGLSIATLLSQHHEVTAVDVVPEKVEQINHRVSPIRDEYIERFFAEKELHLTATTNGREAYASSS